MRAHGSILIAPAHDETQPGVLESARSEPPFSIRECDGRVLVAASAAAPVGGDELMLDIAVLAGARADVGTVASTIVLPGPSGAPSTMTTRCTVGMNAHLHWHGEPTVSVVGSDHTVTTLVDLDATATCSIVEEVSLGRTDEPSGRLRLILRVERGGRPLVHHDELFGPDVPGAGSVVSVGSGRHVLSAVVVGPPAAEPEVVVDGPLRIARLRVAPDAVVILAVGPDRPTVTAAARHHLEQRRA